MTLVEVLVASVLLGVGVTGLVSVASLSMRNQQRVDHRVGAMYLAQEKLASVEMIGPHIWMLGHETQGAEERETMVYDWTIEIEQLGVGELFNVLVEVRWSGPGAGGAVELETWLNDYAAIAQDGIEQREKEKSAVPKEPPGG